MDVRLIAAVGRSGQLGLNGKLPWHDPEDLRWFKHQTISGVVIFGHATVAAMPRLSRLPYREVFIYGRDCAQPEEFLAEIHDSFPLKTIWIAGGARTYATFMPFVRRSFITHVNYDGPADVYMPPLWNNKEMTNG